MYKSSPNMYDLDSVLLCLFVKNDFFNIKGKVIVDKP